MIYDITPTMTYEETFKEMYVKTTDNSHPSKMTMTDIIEICMTYESVCATSRAAVTASGRACVAYTLLEYVAIIDRTVHTDYLLLVAAVAGGGAVTAAPDPFVENLADTHDELTNAFDVFTASKNWNVVYSTGGASVIVTVKVSQRGRIDHGFPF
jgi:protein involved in ribonucleotide reduction